MADNKRYVDNLEKEQLVAFNVCGKMLSGKVKTIGEKHVGIEARNGVQYSVEKKDIAWVKTGERWPKGIYIELRKEVGDDPDVRAN